MKVCEEFYINGEWVKPINDLKTLDVINPATEEVFGRIALGDKDDVDAAVDAHLFNFPKNDKLSFNLQPSLNYTANNELSRGFKLVINL